MTRAAGQLVARRSPSRRPLPTPTPGQSHRLTLSRDGAGAEWAPAASRMSLAAAGPAAMKAH